MPAIVLKKMVMGNFDRGFNDSEICDSIDFLVERVNIFFFCMFQAKWGSFTIVNIHVVCLVFIFSSYFYFSFFSDQFFLAFSQRCLFVYPESFLIKGNECDLYLDCHGNLNLGYVLPSYKFQWE